jgi:hypothetical protein
MPLITLHRSDQNLDQARAESQHAGEQQVLQQIAEAAQANVLRDVPDYRWPPAFVSGLIREIIMLWEEAQLELKRLRAEGERLQQEVTRLHADPARDRLQQTQAAEQVAPHVFDILKVGHLAEF